MRICRSCGAIEASTYTTCALCGALLDGNVSEVAPPEQGLMFVRVQGSFACWACGHDVALNFLDLDGSILCGHCGIDQAFGWTEWSAFLTHAHDVADLGGDDRLPSNDPFWRAMTDFQDEGLVRRYCSLGQIESSLTIRAATAGGGAYQ